MITIDRPVQSRRRQPDGSPLAPGEDAVADEVADSAEDAYRRLFLAELPALVRAVWWIVGDEEEAKAIAQEALTRAYVRWPDVSRLDRPGAWVRRVAIRLAVRSRSRAWRLEALLPRLAGGEPAAGGDAAASLDGTRLADLRVDVRAALDALTPMQRAAVVLRYLADLPVEDVAAELGCRPATASVHLHRARARLAVLLRDDQEETA